MLKPLRTSVLCVLLVMGCSDAGPTQPRADLTQGFIQLEVKARADRPAVYRVRFPGHHAPPDLNASWQTSNGSVVHAVGDSAVVQHEAMGQAEVCVDLQAGSQTASTCTQTQVFPFMVEISATVRPVAGNIPPGTFLFVEHPGGLDSTAVDVDGTALVRLAPEFDGTVASLAIRQSGSVHAPFLPSWRPRFQLSDFRAITALLIPARWTVQNGPWAGMEFALEPDLLTGTFAHLDEDAHPYSTGNHLGMEYGYLDGRMVPTGANHGLVAAVFGWPSSAFPLPVYLERTGHPQARNFTEADSVAIWSALREVERKTGRSLFRAVQAEDVPLLPTTGEGPPARRGVAIFSHPMEFGGLATVKSATVGPLARRELVSGSINIHPDRFEDAATETLHRTVGHESLHILGLGHSCLVPSVMLYPCHDREGVNVEVDVPGLGGEGWWSGDTGPGVLTPLDAALVELREALVQAEFTFLEREPDLSFFEAHEGHRVFTLGTGPMEDPVRYPFARPVTARPLW